jgi:hypothetical protein
MVGKQHKRLCLETTKEEFVPIYGTPQELVCDIVLSNRQDRHRAISLAQFDPEGQFVMAFQEM